MGERKTRGWGQRDQWDRPRSVVARRGPGLAGQGCLTPATGFIPSTDHARHSIGLAMQEARRRGEDHWGPEYLLLGLIGEGEGLAAQALVPQLVAHGLRVRTRDGVVAGPGRRHPVRT